MLKEAALYRKFETVFEDRQAALLAETITEAYTDLVKTSDFNELKEIVHRLAQAQERTEARIESLAQAQERTEARLESLAQAQERTEARLESLAQAQERTEVRLGSLAQAQERTEAAVQKMEAAVQKLALGLTETRREVGGLSRSMSYALENEAYHSLPAFLKERFGIEITERLVRTEINGEEINFFGHALRNDAPIIIVGETKLRLDERRRGSREDDLIIEQLTRKLETVRNAYPEATLVPLLVTHYARTAFARQVEERGILLVQSFEW